MRGGSEGGDLFASNRPLLRGAGCTNREDGSRGAASEADLLAVQREVVFVEERESALGAVLGGAKPCRDTGGAGSETDFVRDSPGPADTVRRQLSCHEGATRTVDDLDLLRGERSQGGVEESIDSHEQRGATGFENGILAGEERLSRRGELHRSPSTTRAPPAGAQTSTSRTPAIARSVLSTRGASSGAQSATTCGPASIVAQAPSPPSRNRRSA